MGYFQDAFSVGAGATLGNLAVNTGYNIGANMTNSAVRNGYTQYRSQYFDPVVRTDICNLMVHGFLSQIEYPFPRGEKKENFFKQHKMTTLLLIGFVIIMFVMMFFPDVAASGNFTGVATIYAFLLLVVAPIRYIYKKIVNGGKKMIENKYKPQLDSDGEQYWYIREYVRQALASNEITVNDAILKISNTNLAQQFPDTVEEIEANAFYHRQGLRG